VEMIIYFMFLLWKGTKVTKVLFLNVTH